MQALNFPFFHFFIVVINNKHDKVKHLSTTADSLILNHVELMVEQPEKALGNLIYKV